MNRSNKGAHKSTVVATTLAHINRLELEAIERGECGIFRAGSPVAQRAPDGLGKILRQGGNKDLGGSAGLTLIKHAEAFKAPTFTVKDIIKKEGHTPKFFAQVVPTTATDITHESYFPAPGDHIRPGMTARENGKLYTYYWRISSQISALIKKGEEEHLADAELAFKLTYGRIAEAINSLTSQTFGPADSREAAGKLAEEALAKILPKELGTDPVNWPKALDRLLDMTLKRDREGWHNITAGGPLITDGLKRISVAARDTKTKVGTVASKEVVKY